MRTSLRMAAGILAGSLILTAIGAALGCNDAFCDVDVTGCQPQEFVDTMVCCKDSDEDGIWHCITCDRRLFMCFRMGMPLSMWGPTNSCYGPGDECQPW